MGRFPATSAEPRAVISVAATVYPALAAVVPRKAIVHFPIGAPHLLRRTFGDGLKDSLDSLVDPFLRGH
jgi:hypothetical protein